MSNIKYFEYLKNDVPSFYKYISGTNKQISKSNFHIKSDDTTKIAYSFDKESCSYIYPRTMEIEQIKSIMQFLKINNISNDYNKNVKLLTAFLDQSYKNKSYYKDEMLSQIMNLYKSYTYSSELVTDTSKKLFNEVKCFINTSFENVKFADIVKKNYDFSISICTSEENVFMDIATNKIAGGYLSPSNGIFSTGTKFQQSMVIFDELIEENLENNINTIKHEILHLFGLEHPKYNNIDHHYKYRTIVEDEHDSTSPLYIFCARKHKFNASTEITKESDYQKPKVKNFFECIKAPVELTPVDIKSLISIWGMSKDETKYCHDIRQDFIEKYNEYFDINRLDLLEEKIDTEWTDI